MWVSCAYSGTLHTSCWLNRFFRSLRHGKYSRIVDCCFNCSCYFCGCLYFWKICYRFGRSVDHVKPLVDISNTDALWSWLNPGQPPRHRRTYNHYTVIFCSHIPRLVEMHRPDALMDKIVNISIFSVTVFGICLIETTTNEDNFLLKTPICFAQIVTYGSFSTLSLHSRL